MRKLAIIVAALLAVVFTVSAVAALPTVDQVKINGDVVASGGNLVVQRGDTVDVRVKLHADTNMSNVEVTGEILGYEHNDRTSNLYDRASLFDMQAGDTVYKDLQLTVPTDAQKDYYDLRVQVGDRTGPINESLYTLRLSGQRHKLVIKDITFNPSEYVQSGRAFLSQVRVENIGDKDEKNVKVTLRMPQAGVTATDYIDEIRPGDSQDSSDMFLRVPNCLKSGTYDVVASISYDDGYESDSYTTQVNVVSDDQLCNNQTTTQQQRVLIEVQPPKPVSAGNSVVFPVMVTNAGTKSQTLVLSVSGADTFGSARVTPSAFLVVPPNGRSTAYVEVSANKDATAGTKVLSLSLATADGTQLGSSAVPVTVEAAQGYSFSGNWQRVLEISLLVLVVVLIVLGIIVAVSRMRDDEREGGEGSQAYY